MLRWQGRTPERPYISDGLWICILLEMEEDRVGYGEMKGWDGPVSVEGIKDEPEGQQSRDADGCKAKDGIPHLGPLGLPMSVRGGEQILPRWSRYLIVL